MIRSSSSSAALASRCVRATSLIALGAILPAAYPSNFTNIKPYLTAVSPDYVIQPLISVGDRVPDTADPTKSYQMIGNPDGLGTFKGQGNTTVVMMAHELAEDVLSEPNVGGALQRGSFVSRFVLDQDGSVLSGARAYDEVNDSKAGTKLPAAQVGNTTRGFSKFCSGSIAWKEAGFDRPIYFTGEEEAGPGSFDGKGGLGVAIFDGELHTLIKLGRFSHENLLVRPHAGDTTVILATEDGPGTPDSQLYLYVGRKSTARNASVLSRNGLDTGKLYTFVSTTSGQTSELTFTTGSISGKWVELPDQADRTAAELESDADAAGAFGFLRIEDGAWDKTDRNTFYFVTTGGATGNKLGRIYELKFDRNDILGPCTLRMIYNCDTVAAAGGDIAFSPDNVATSERFLMIQEDGTSDGRAEYASRGRDGSIWRLDLRNNFAATRVAELNPNGVVPAAPVAPATVGVPPSVGPGVWESSGIVDVSPHFGQDSWLTAVQAHAPSLAPAPNTVADGQLLLILSAKPNRGTSSDDDREQEDEEDEDRRGRDN